MCIRDSSRSSNHQHSFGNLASKTLEFLGILEELDEFPNLLFGFTHACHILESHLFGFHLHLLRLALAKTHCPASSHAHLLTEEKVKDQQNKKDWQQPKQHTAEYLNRITAISEKYMHLRKPPQKGMVMPALTDKQRGFQEQLKMVRLMEAQMRQAYELSLKPPPAPVIVINNEDKVLKAEELQVANAAQKQRIEQLEA